MKIIWRQFFLFLLICFIIGIASACAFLSDNTKMSKTPLKMSVSSKDVNNKTEKSEQFVDNPYEGSLWTPKSSRAFMYGDPKARNTNDILTVKIIEITDASRNASTKLARKNGMSAAITKFFGSPLTFGMDNLWGKNTGAATAAERVERPFMPELESTTKNSFDGAGSTTRNDKFIATVSVRVVDVYPNGNMFIKGKKEVTINNENQYICLSGFVRPEDVSFNNVVLSSSIADAKISISGKGVIADKQSPGFGHRIFDWVWPF